MTAEKSNRKKSPRITPENLRARCAARQLTITALAAKIGSPRNMVYLAVEKPTRYSGTYERIVAALA